MILIFGGVYQGKLSYALDRFNLSDDDVWSCRDDTCMPENKRLVYEIDRWILSLLKAGIDTEEMTRRFIKRNPDTIVICNDISCGVVPINAIERKWRELVGRTLAELSRHSNEVVRLFCGIPTRIK